MRCWSHPKSIKELLVSSQKVFRNHQRCSVKKVFLEISQNSQEKTCAGVSFFNKVAGLRHLVIIFLFSLMRQSMLYLSQPEFLFSKLQIETLKKVWNMFKVNNKDAKTTPIYSGPKFVPCNKWFKNSYLEFICILDFLIGSLKANKN